MPFLGVSSLDLGRLRQRRRPLYLVYFTLLDCWLAWPAGWANFSY
jgi:hypothetical protein